MAKQYSNLVVYRLDKKFSWKFLSKNVEFNLNLHTTDKQIDCTRKLINIGDLLSGVTYALDKYIRWVYNVDFM